MLIGMLKKTARALGAYGREELDTTPVAVPAGFKRPETLQEQIKRLIQQPGIGKALSGNDDAEDFDEANDFDVPDDPTEPVSEHEEFWDPALMRGVTAAEVLNPSQKQGLDKATEKAQARRRPSKETAPQEPQNPAAGASSGPGAPPPPPAVKPTST